MHMQQKHKHTKSRVHWLGWQPTPYNDSLFISLAAEANIDLTVHYSNRVALSHPWQTKLAQGYRARYYRCVLGIDWHVLSLAFRERDAFFVIASWVHPTAILLIILLGLRGRRFALWTDTPNRTQRRKPLFAFLRSLWLKWIFRNATKVMGTGQPAVEALRAAGAPEDKLVVFPYWIDVDAYACEKRRVDLGGNPTIQFVSAGRLINSLKGHDIALRALAQAGLATGKEFEYAIAGIGEDEEDLKRLTEELEIANRVRFLGWIEPDELMGYLDAADALIHASPVHEPYGVAVLEAMASGLVVLASDVTCAALDRIEHSINGFIHPAGDVQSLAEQIEFLLRNPCRFDEIGHKARVTAEIWPISRGVQIVKSIIAGC
jgi:glycosyltransferase involved in cell wall biosynthesis